MSSDGRLPRLRAVDLFVEIMASVLTRPGRSLLVALGTVIGTASFLATLGITATLGNQVTSQFDAFRATEIVASVEDAADPSALPVDGVERLNGVLRTGWRLAFPAQQVQRTTATDPFPTTLSAVDHDAMHAIAPTAVRGTTFDLVHHNDGARVIMLGAGTADRLGVLHPGEAVLVNGAAFTVIGIYDDVRRRPDVLLGGMVPLETRSWLLDVPQVSLVTETSPGATLQIAGQLPLALRPEAPDTVTVVAAPDPDDFRRGVESDLRGLGVLASLLSLAIGIVSIASAASAATVQRTGEIGLRRAMGALRRHVFFQLLGESLVLGLFGGVVGAVLGFATVLSVGIYNGWSVVIDVRLGGLAAALGVATGLLAGLLPALRGMRVMPSDAIRQ